MGAPTTNPGRTAYEARFAGETMGPRGTVDHWDDLPDAARAVWRRVEETCAEMRAAASSNEIDDARAEAALKVWREIHDTANVDDDPEDLDHTAMLFAIAAAEEIGGRAVDAERIAKLETHLNAAVLDVATQARLRGEAEGKLRVSEMAGIVAGWRDRALAAEAKTARLLIAFHDATRRPLGVTPDSGIEFYDPRLADEAEAQRPRHGSVEARGEQRT